MSGVLQIPTMSDKRDIRGRTVSIRVTAAERSAWEQAAESDGRSLASWVVRRVNGQPATAPTLSAPAKRPRRA